MISNCCMMNDDPDRDDDDDQSDQMVEVDGRAIYPGFQFPQQPVVMMPGHQVILVNNDNRNDNDNDQD